MELIARKTGASNQMITRANEVSEQERAKWVSRAKIKRQAKGAATKNVTMAIKIMDGQWANKNESR